VHHSAALQGTGFAALVAHLFVPLWTAFFCSAPRACAEPSTGEGWTVATLARDGSWGVATEASLAHAIGMAVSKCKAMAVPQSDCGAQFTTIRTGWTLALLCGDHKVLAAAKRLDEAWLAVQFRLELKQAYLPDLPACRLIFKVDAAGRVILPASETSEVLSR
jgi:hypothetical protein